MDRWAKAAVALFGLAIIVVLGLEWVLPPTVADRMRDSDPRVRERLFALIQPVSIPNCTLARFGEPHDGGYLMCENLLAGVESAYSYGISGYDGWGCDVATRANVPLHQYDCFDTRQPACPTARTVFHAECVGPATTTEEGRAFDTIENHLRRNGDSGKRIVLKMDVEGAEWDPLLHASPATLDGIDQLAIEFHEIGEERFVKVAERLKEHFYVAYLHVNNQTCGDGMDPFPGWAYEVLYVNKRIAQPNLGDAAASRHPAEAPNNPAKPDCQPPLSRD